MLKIMCQVGNGKPYESLHNNGCVWKTFNDFEKGIAVCTSGPYAQDYIVQCGAVKRRYRFNNLTKKWERVLHPRGTKRKAKPATSSAEVKPKEVKAVDFWSDMNNQWIGSTFSYTSLMHYFNNKKMVVHHHRVTFADDTVEYYRTNERDYILVKADTDPSLPKVNKIEATPVKGSKEKVCHFWSVSNKEWLKSVFDLVDLNRAVATKKTQHPSYLHYRVTFDDGSVTYFTRDGEGKPLYQTSEDPTVNKVVEPTPPAPVSVPWHVAYLDIVNNGAKYTCVYKGGCTFELEEHNGYVKFKHNSRSAPLLVFKFTPSAVDADYYKKETK